MALPRWSGERDFWEFGREQKEPCPTAEEDGSCQRLEMPRCFLLAKRSNQDERIESINQQSAFASGALWFEMHMVGVHCFISTIVILLCCA